MTDQAGQAGPTTDQIREMIRKSRAFPKASVAEKLALAAALEYACNELDRRLSSPAAPLSDADLQSVYDNAIHTALRQHHSLTGAEQHSIGLRALAALRGDVEGAPSAATQLQAIAAMLPASTRYSSKPLVERVREALRGDGVRERDKLFCMALIGSGIDTRDMHKVLRVFNEIRPDRDDEWLAQMQAFDAECERRLAALASPVPPKEET